jgi:predicted  nucleic acid-binding Zn-ribbon protein
VLCVLLQLLQSELKACQQRQQQQAAQYESAISVLQADVAALRDRLDDSQQHTRSAVDHLRSSTALQLEKQAQETEEQLQVCRGSAATNTACLSTLASTV